MNDTKDGGKPRIVLDRPWLNPAHDKVARDRPRDLAQPCALKTQAPCCGGRGYVVTQAGAYTHAELCGCILGCGNCHGRAHQIVDDVAIPCRTPPPTLVANLINSAQIPARYAQASLAKFANNAGNGRMLVGEISRWQKEFRPVGGRGLVIEGAVGIGKTYLLAAIAKEMAERAYSVRFTDFFQLLGELKTGFSQGKADAAQLAPLIDVDVLIIDELGKGRNNDFELTVLDQLVCGRYNQNKTIVASTNYRLKNRPGFAYNIDLDRPGGGQAEFASDRFEGLEQRIGPRIFSRLREMTTFLELTGDDMRARAPAHD